MTGKAIDVMVDLETTGLYPGCSILSLGATTLDHSDSFYTRISIDSCHAAGLHDLPSTMAWWQRQSKEARDEAFSGMEPLMEALGRFADWYVRLGPVRNTYIWGNGADFDQPILAAAYRAVDIAVPWAPFNARCYRTLKNLYQMQVPEAAFDGVKHNALADAKHQASHMLRILQYRKQVEQPMMLKP